MTISQPAQPERTCRSTRQRQTCSFAAAAGRL